MSSGDSHGRLTTHVLDTMAGRPAAGVAIALRRATGPTATVLAQTVTDDDGRAPGPLLEGDAFETGSYELLFHVADYFRAQGVSLSEPPFLDVVSIRFAIADRTSHYHVPLLISPYGYTTYRGS